MSNHPFRITPRMINKEALRFLKQYASRAITLEVAMEEIQYILESNFDEDEWMDITQYILIDPLCFADIEKEFLEKLGEQESSNATTGSLSEAPCPSNPGTRNLPAADRDSETDPLLKDLSAWRLVMDWAQEKLNYPPNLTTELGNSGHDTSMLNGSHLSPHCSHYLTPPTKTPRSPSSLVEQAMQSHGVSFVTSTNPLLHISAHPGKAPRKRRKTGISKFFDLAAAEKDSDEDDEEEEDFGETRWRTSAIDGMMARYSGMSQRRDIQTHKVSQILEGIPLPLMKNVYVVDLYSGKCPDFSEVRNRLPPSHRSATKEIILLPPAEATSLAAFEAQQTLPIRTWSGEKSLFSSELATLASLALEPITSPIGEDVGFRCGGHDFICGLLRLTVPTHSVVSVELPIPDDIAFHMVANFERTFVEKTVHLFSAQFWRESDTVEICEGELSGSRGKLIDVEWQKRTASVLLLNPEAREGDLDDKDEAIHCCIQELRRVFSTGQTVRIIAGPYRGYVGHIITASGGSVSLQYDGQSPHLEVSELLLETHVPDHVRSLSTKHDAGMRMNLPEPADKVLPGDTAVVCRGAYKGAEATIEWMNSNGDQAWIYVKEVSDSSSTQGDTGTTSTQHPSTQGDTDTASAQHPAGYKMVPVNVHDVRVHRAPRTISFTKEKGFDVCAGDDIEVARGKWFRSRGTVQAVHFDQACLDFVCDTYGQNISVPITFCRKIAERSAAQLWRWVGRDVWVIRGEKKGYQGTLRSTGQGVSQVALQGQLVQLRNNHIATPTGLVLDGTLLPLGTVQELQRRSFVTVVRSITPPPSAPSPVVEGSSTVTSDAWRVTAEDLTPTASVYGEIPWLFQPNFCDFTRLLLGLTVNDHYRPYNNASIGKRIVRTRRSNPFSSDSGVVPLGHVCVTVTGHNRGSAVQTHVIPATCLRPANPSAKNQLCVVTEGPRLGEVLNIKHCQKNARKIVAQDGTVMSFEESQHVRRLIVILVPIPLARDKDTLCLRVECYCLQRTLNCMAGERLIDVGLDAELAVGEWLTRTADEDEAEKYDSLSTETDYPYHAAVLKLVVVFKVSDVVVVVEPKVSDAIVRVGVSGGGPLESKSVVVDFDVVIIVSTDRDGVEMA
ncbi:hypothetical protein F5141DRAFT_1068815 [Pisolithus sp. B1]|nr:hypothetical protein F5141DRAFT_1068815 [Pisolithus sp. B1]